MNVWQVVRRPQAGSAPTCDKTGLEHGPTPASSPTIQMKRMGANAGATGAPPANPLCGATGDQRLVVSPDYMLRGRQVPNGGRRIANGLVQAGASNSIRARIPGLNYGGS